MDHHYNEGKDWDFNNKELREKHKERGSFSNIKSIIWHHDTHSEALNEQQNKLELKKYYKKGLGDSTKNNHKQFNTPSTYDNDQRILPSNNIQSELRETSNNKDVNNGNLQRYERFPLETKKTKGFSKGFRQGKTKNTNSKSKTIDESGWQPIINDDEEFKQHSGGQHFNFKEHKLQYNGEENVHQHKSYADINDKKTKDVNGNNQEDSSKGIWSKQYMQVNKKGNRFTSHVSQGQVLHQTSQPYLGKDFESLGDFNRQEYLKHIQPTNLHATPTWFQQSPTQSQHYPQTHYLKSKAVSQHQVNLKADPDQVHAQGWRLQKQNLQPQLYQETHKYEHFEQSNPQHQQQKTQQQTYQQQNHQQYVRQQPLHHSTIARPETQPQSPKMIMSEHKFQTPQHSMWLVQEHSVLPAPVQGHTTSHKPLLFQKPVLSSPSLLDSKLPNQVLQDNTRGHEVNHQHRKVKQQWHQSVETSGVDGPASSYKVEVINYSPIEKAHPLPQNI